MKAPKKGHLDPFIILIFIIAGILCLASARDSDIWFNLASGRYIAENRMIPAADVFSFTRYGQPWIDRLWLFQLIAYLVFSIGAAWGLVAFEIAVIYAVMGYMLRSSTGESDDRFLARCCAAAFVLTAHFRFLVRPEAMSFLFLSLTAYIINRYRAGSGARAVWALPFIQLIWVNMHGLYILGLALQMSLLAGTFMGTTLDRWLPGTFDGSLPAGERNKILIVCVLSIGSSFANPFGWRGAVVPFEQFSMMSPASIFSNVRELVPTLRASLIGLSAGLMSAVIGYAVFLALTALSFFARFRDQRKIDVYYLLIAFSFAYISMKAMRNIPLFCIIAFPILIDQLRSVVVSRKYRIVIGACTIMCAALLSSPSVLAEYGGVVEKDIGLSMERTVDFIKGAFLRGRMFNQDVVFGNYALWRLGERSVFVDGRLEVYGEDFYRKTFSSYLSRERFFGMLAEYDISFVVASSALLPTRLSGVKQAIIDRIQDLARSNDWRLVFLDPYFMVFLKKNDMNRQAVERYGYDFTALATAERLCEALPPVPGARLMAPKERMSPRIVNLIKSLFLFSQYRWGDTLLDEYRDMLTAGERSLLQGISALEQGDASLAERYWMGSAGEKKTRCESLYRLALLSKQSPDNDRTERLLREGLAHANGSEKVPFLFELAGIAVREKDFRTAARLYRQVIDVDPFSEDAFVNLGSVYAQMGDYRLAERYWRAALAVNPSSENAMKNLTALGEMRLP